MVSPKFIKSLQKTATDLDGASKELHQIAKTFEEVELYNPINKMISIVSILELATVRARSLTGRLVDKEAGYFYEESARVMGISVTEEHDWIKITVPCMLPKRNHKVNNAFRTFRRCSAPDSVHDQLWKEYTSALISNPITLPLSVFIADWIR